MKPLASYHRDTFWTDERVERLEQMHAKGHTTGEIAIELGTTRNSVIGKLTRLRKHQRRRRDIIPKAPPSTMPRQRENDYSLGSMMARLNAGSLPRPAPKPVSKPRPARPEPAEPLSATRCTIMELTSKTCSWPLFEGREAFHEKFYCGGQTIEGTSYCGHHSKIAFTAGRPRS
jgi:GcrA cell cycle regulator